MRLTRVFHDGPLEMGAVVSLSEANARHLRTVLRLRTGQELILFNGEGGEFQAHIHDMDKKSLRVEITHHMPVNRESSLRLILAQGIAKGQRMDYSIQKAVELGVYSIQPLLTERCAVRPKGDRPDRKESHWQGVITSAAEQSGRTALPRLEKTSSLHNYLERVPQEALKLVLDPQAKDTVHDIKPSGQDIHILTGPEGGLSDRETRLAREAGFKGIRMGPRILRTETAGIAAIAVMQALWGDMSLNDYAL